MSDGCQAIKWSDVQSEYEAIHLGYRERVVALFRKYEGQDTDEAVRGKPVKVTVKSFAKHTGIPYTTFLRWTHQFGVSTSLIDEPAACINGGVPPAEGFVREVNAGLREVNARLRECVPHLRHLSGETHRMILEDIAETERDIGETKRLIEEIKSESNLRSGVLPEDVSRRTRQPSRGDVEGFLLDVLSDGPRQKTDIQHAAQERHIPWAAVRRAKEDLGVGVRGSNGAWAWELPADTRLPSSPNDSTPPTPRPALAPHRKVPDAPPRYP